MQSRETNISEKLSQTSSPWTYLQLRGKLELVTWDRLGYHLKSTIQKIQIFMRKNTVKKKKFKKCV